MFKFLKPSRTKQAEMQPNSRFPNLSLTSWGNPVLAVIDKEFKKAQNLSYAGYYEKAQQCFFNCFELCAKYKSALFVDQYLVILLQLAYVAAELGDLKRAYVLHQIHKETIQQEKGWYETLPKGLRIVFHDSYEPEHPLAKINQELGIISYQLKNFESGSSYFRQSSECFAKLGDINSIAHNSQILVDLAKHYQRYDDIKAMADQLYGTEHPSYQIQRLAIELYLEHAQLVEDTKRMERYRTILAGLNKPSRSEAPHASKTKRKMYPSQPN